MGTLEWFRSTLDADTPPSGLSPALQALWFAGKTEFNVDELFEIFDRIGGNGTAADGTVYAPGTSPPPESAGPTGSAPWLWTVGHAICQTVEFGYNPGNKPDQPPNDPDLSWVHAHLHRLESDFSNASGWYGRSSAPDKPSPDELATQSNDLACEWETIALALLHKSKPTDSKL